MLPNNILGFFARDVFLKLSLELKFCHKYITQQKLSAVLVSAVHLNLLTVFVQAGKKVIVFMLLKSGSTYQIVPQLSTQYCALCWNMIS